jgi:integrase
MMWVQLIVHHSEGQSVKTGKLSATKVAKEKAQGLYGDGGNLYLQVGREPHMRSWLFRFTINGRPRAMGLGSVSTLSLAEARQRAQEARKLLLDEIDPIEHRDAERAQRRLEAAKNVTFQECAARYIAAHKSGWSHPKSAQQWTNTIAAYVAPVFGDLPVASIDTAMVMRALSPIWQEKTKTAAKLRGRLESILGWATTSGFREGPNPAAWKNHLENLLPPPTRVAKVEHHAALPYAEVGAFMVDLRAQEGIAAAALEFCILTAARTGEVLGARWSEVDLGAALWTIPSERTKARKEHRIPLAPATLAVLERMRGQSSGEFVFTAGNGPLGATALSDRLARMNRSGLTVHGFRSAFRDWAAEQTAFPHEVAEMALGHAVGSAVERAYQRGELLQKRRKLMEAWAAYCAAPVKGGKVVAMRRVSE